MLDCTASIKDGVARASQGGIDIVLLKINHADDAGTQLLASTIAALPHIPIIVMTDEFDDQFALEAIRLGAQDYLIKDHLESVWLMNRLKFAICRNRVVANLRISKKREQHLATHDMLTGLPNRQLFYDRFDQALANARRCSCKMAIMFLDLDNFKQINDSLGHDVGDRLLRSVAKRLSANIRQSDTVARIGGDEFTVIINNLSSLNAMHTISAKIFKTMAADYILDQHRLPVTTSMGVAVYPDDGNDRDILLKKADLAMYHAKKLGRNSLQVYKDVIAA